MEEEDRGQTEVEEAGVKGRTGGAEEEDGMELEEKDREKEEEV